MTKVKLSRVDGAEEGESFLVEVDNSPFSWIMLLALKCELFSQKLIVFSSSLMTNFLWYRLTGT